MKISPDQNTITLDDGTVLVAQPHESGDCTECHFDYDGSLCQSLRAKDIPCWSCERKDNTSVIFIKESRND
jgi:hypothetical protein